MLLWLFVVLPAVLGQAGFGRSYLKNSRLCHQWNCINTNLRLPDSLPYQYDTMEALRRVLPVGSWQEVVDTVVENCYKNRTKRYTNTCPGQALLHCVVDQMIDNCPEEHWRKDDACSPVTSLAGQKNMFSQSRYENLEKNLPKELRPSWFLKNYFNSNCCELPEMFNQTLLQVCGFSSFISYHTHGPKYTDVKTVDLKIQARVPVTTPSNNGDTLKIVDFNQISLNNDITDPLECCDMTQFIQPSWRSECDFNLKWGGQDRLVISSKPPVSTEASVTSLSMEASKIMDSMLIPQSCEKETCVFRNLGIVNPESGAIDIDAYIKMLHNLTEGHPEWAKGKARVVTKCLTRPLSRSYDSGCEINDLLSCTFDVLTEKCPSINSRVNNNCKHDKHQAGCQISSSKYRPKNRREFCTMPPLVDQNYLSMCGLDSLYRIEQVAVPLKPKTHGWPVSKYMCKDSTSATTCILNKMGVLNKYKFMDYFRMKDRIRQFTKEQAEWAALLDIYMSAFMNIPMYSDHCNSQKKLLNVVDAMLMTCPISKRKNTAVCNKIFTEMTNTTPIDNRNVTREKLDEILKHYYHIFMPHQLLTPKLGRVIRKKHSKVVKHPLFEFGLLNSKDAPPVKVIDVKPVPTSYRPLILQPVYLRPNFNRPSNNDDAFRSLNNPFSLHEHIAQAHTSTVTPNVHTVPTINNNVYSTRPLLPSTVPTYTQNVTANPGRVVT